MISAKTKENCFCGEGLERGNQLDALWEFRICAQTFLCAGQVRGVLKSKLICPSGAEAGSFLDAGQLSKRWVSSSPASKNLHRSRSQAKRDLLYDLNHAIEISAG
jgi:hypothetical protein